MSFILLGILNSQAEAAGGAGAYDLLETQVLQSDASTVSFTNLNSTYGSDYKHIQLRMTLRTTFNQNYAFGGFRLNGVGTSDYAFHDLEVSGGNVRSTADTNKFFIDFEKHVAGNALPTGDFGASVLDILDAFNASKLTTTRQFGGRPTSDGLSLTSGLFLQAAPIESIEFFPQQGNWLTGSRFSLYGIKAA